MERWLASSLDQFRNYRQRKLLSVGTFLANRGLTANLLTGFSLLFGLLSVYFLFEQQVLFILLALLHLAADALDGVIARATKETSFGKYFDYGVDRLVTLLFLLKIGFFLQDYYAYLIAGIFVVAQLIYIFSQFRAPIVFTRTVLLLILFFYSPVYALTAGLPIIAYLVTGAASLYSLARQLQWFAARW